VTKKSEKLDGLDEDEPETRQGVAKIEKLVVVEPGKCHPI
jgi:hypothetical protein